MKAILGGNSLEPKSFFSCPLVYRFTEEGPRYLIRVQGKEQQNRLIQT